MFLVVASLILSSILSLLNVHFAVQITQAIHEFRRCAKENPSGGNYQKFSLAEHVAVRYLKYEIVVANRIPEGYNVYPFSFERRMMYKGY